MAIRYKNILDRLRDTGLTTVRIRREGLMAESTMTRIRNNQPITTESIDVICNLLHCQPNDIMEVIYDYDSKE